MPRRFSRQGAEGARNFRQGKGSAYATASLSSGPGQREKLFGFCVTL